MPNQTIWKQKEEYLMLVYTTPTVHSTRDFMQPTQRRIIVTPWHSVNLFTVHSVTVSKWINPQTKKGIFVTDIRDGQRICCQSIAVNLSPNFLLISRPNYVVQCGTPSIPSPTSVMDNLWTINYDAQKNWTKICAQCVIHLCLIYFLEHFKLKWFIIFTTLKFD